MDSETPEPEEKPAVEQPPARPPIVKGRQAHQDDVELR